MWLGFCLRHAPSGDCFFFLKMSNVRRPVPCGVHFLVWKLQRQRSWPSRGPHQPCRGRVWAVQQQQSCLTWLKICGVGNGKEKTVFHWGKSKAFGSITDLTQILLSLTSCALEYMPSWASVSPSLKWSLFRVTHSCWKQGSIDARIPQGLLLMCFASRSSGQSEA